MLTPQPDASIAADLPSVDHADIPASVPPTPALTVPSFNPIENVPALPQPAPAQPPVLPQTYRKFGDVAKTRQLIFDNVLKAASTLPPMTNTRHAMHIENVRWSGPETYSIADQKQAILSRGTLGRKLIGEVVLRNPDGSEVERRNTQLARVPYMTDRGTFIVNGNEYTMSHQMRLRPGVFTRKKQNGELESHVNVAKGYSHRIELDPATGVFKVNIGQAHIQLMPLLRAMGVPETKIRETWGNELTSANMQKEDTQAMRKLHEKLFRGKPAGEEGVNQSVVKAFNDMVLDPDVTKRTLGQGFSNVGPDTLLAITNKLLRVAKQEDEPDDRDAMAYQTLVGPEDVLAERIHKSKNILRKLFWKASGRGNLQNVSSNSLDEAIRAGLLTSGLGQPLSEINPAEIFDQHSRVTRMGEGGITSMDAVPDEARAVQPSQFGFIDYLRTPECYDYATEVMTRKGWKFWPDVVATDELACQVDGRLEFHVPHVLHRYMYNGEMCGVDTGRINYLVTPNHRVWVRGLFKTAKYHFELADQVKNFRKVQSGGFLPYLGTAADTFRLPYAYISHNPKQVATATNIVNVDHIDIDDWAEFMGWWLGEGSTYYKESNGDGYVSYRAMISQSRSANPENYMRIEQLLNRLPFKFYKDNDNRGFRLTGKQLTAYLKQFGGSVTRRIPEELLRARTSARQRLLEALLLAEGRRDRSGVRTQFCTTSKQLADDFQRLAFSLGFSTQYAWEPDDREQSNHGGAHIIHVHKFNEHQLHVKRSPSQGGHSDHYRQQYNDYVYCATVPGGLLYVRRQGMLGHWSGNSGKVGVDARIANATVKGDNGQIYTKVRLRDGTDAYKTPQDFADATVAFPNEMTSPDGYVAALQKGRFTMVPRDAVDFEVPNNEDVFSPLGNMIPFKSTLKGQRAVMAARMMTQALPLRNAEAPHVQSGIAGEKGVSYEDRYAKHMGAVHAEQPARIIDVNDNGITMVNADGEKKTIQLYHNFPFNQKSVCSDTRVIVRKNDASMWEGRIADYLFTVGDHVLSIDTDTQRSSWQLITGFTRHENDKKTYRICTASGRDVVVTQDHSLVTLGSDGMLQPVYPLDCIVGKTRLPIALLPHTPTGSEIYTYELGQLAGLYLAEGHCPPSQPGCVIIAVEPDNRADQVLALLKCLSHAPYRNGGSVAFTDHARCQWLVDTFGHLSGHKFIPASVLSMPRDFLTGLIEGYFAGDGCLSADSNDAIQLSAVSTSQKLRDGIVDVLSCLGVFTTLWDAPRQCYNPNWNDGYGLRVISTHITRLSKWFFYTDREAALRGWVKDVYRASPFEMVPVANKAARKTLYASFADDVPVYVYKTAHQGAVAKHRLQNCTGVYGKWGTSDVMWDTIVSITPVTLTDNYVYDFSVSDSEVFAVCHGLIVHNTYVHQTPMVGVGDIVKPGQLLAKSNFTDDKGTTALGLNARVAYIPWGGLNFEDANVVSESFAKRMSSEHMYQHDHEWESNDKKGLNSFRSIFPAEYDRKTLSQFDEHGVIKPGTPVKQGDPLILIARAKELNKKSLLRGTKPIYQNMSQLWENSDEGVVTDVVHTPKGAAVVVKATVPMQVGDKMCFDEDTEVLTKRGWVYIADVLMTDEICTLQRGDEIDYLHPIALHRYATGGRMYKIKSQQVDQFVTINHRQYVRKRNQNTFMLERAENVYGKRVCYKKNGNWQGVSPTTVTIDGFDVRAGRSGNGKRRLPDVTLSVETYLTLLGAFISEGNLVNQPKSGTYGIDITQIKQPNRSQIMDELSRLDVHFNEHNHNEKIRVHSKVLYNHFAQFGRTAKEKHLPAEIFNWAKADLQILFRWLMWGDGTVNHVDRPICYTTTSPQLADDVQRLCLHIGYAANVIKDHDGGTQTIKGTQYYCQPRYSVRVVTTKLTPMVNHGHTKTQCVQEECIIENYDRPVYCVTVPGHVLYVRRNGKPCWSGNSGRFGDKGIVSHIIPDDQMMTDKDGKPFEVLLNPLGITSRTNPAQIIEAALGKVAAMRGEAYKVPDFQDEDDMVEFALGELRKHGLDDSEQLTDPRTNRKIPDVFTGSRWIMKLHHTAESKGQGRGLGAYTAEGTPAKGGSEGCFIGSQKIETIQGPKRISEICEKQLGIYVRTFSERLQEWVYRPVIDWFTRRANVKDMLTIEFAGGPCTRDSRCNRTGSCIYPTPNHEVLLADGTRKLAGDVRVGDQLVTWGLIPSADQLAFMLGTLLGDASVNTHYLSVEHSVKQIAYVNWKKNVLAGICPEQCDTSHTGGKNALPGLRGKTHKGRQIRIAEDRIVHEMRKLCYTGDNDTKHITDEWLSQLNGLSVVIWLLDDGSITNRAKKAGKLKLSGNIATNGFNRDDRNKLVAWLRQWSGETCSTADSGAITLSSRICHRLVAEVAKWVPAAVIPGSKKVLKRLVAEIQQVTPPRRINNVATLGKVPLRVVDVRPYKHDKPGVAEINVYDFTVADTHTYVAGQALVSNSKRIGMLETNALLSHGATQFLRNSSLIRGQSNPQLWAQYMSGNKMPTVAVPHVYHKYVNNLRSAGINVVREGTRLNVMALTDKDIDQLAADREIKNAETVDWKTMEPVRGGLFDTTLTGGHATSEGGGNRWSYIKLHEPLPNPVMEEPIRRVLGLTTNKFNDILSGKERLNDKTGPTAIAEALGNINVDSELARARADIASNKKTARDAAIRRLNFLKSAQRLGIHPKDWMLSRVPVLPPAFRPVSTMGANKLPLVADANYLYKELFDANSGLKEIAKQLDPDDLGDERMAVYNAFKAVTGLGDPTHAKNQERGVKGILKHVFGSSPKLGAVQRRLLGSSTDLVGRAVIAPDPDLDMDQVGLPENQAWTIYRPVLIHKLVRKGMPRLQAARAVEERSQAARTALLDEMDNGVVVINRAPTLHRYGMMAARPRLVKGDVLKISPLVVGGFGADFDGDAMQYHVPVGDEEKQEVMEKMLPSRNLFSAATFKVHLVPTQEYIGGLYTATTNVDDKNPPVVFDTAADAIRAYQQGRLDASRRVHIVNE